MKRTLFVAFALLLGALVANEAQAHIVPVGVGTQTWIDVRPRKITVRFNLGFSSLLGQGELTKADTNKNGFVDRDEERAYLEALGARVLPKLDFRVDGKPIELHVVNKQAAGLYGEIAAVGFDTFYDLEADVDLGGASHELTYFEGTYQGEISQQILYVVNEKAADFADFDLEQKTPGPVVEQEGAFSLQGRDVAIKFRFAPKALERDRAEALIEPSLAGLQDTLDALATTVARATEKDLAPLPTGEVTLGVSQSSVLLGRPRGFSVSKPTAADRGTGSKLVGVSTTDAITKEMGERVKAPFTILAMFVFFVWGCAHALMPGHGKTMVAAYLLGTKGRLWDAARLGAIVTFTHTFTVYTLGLGLVYLVGSASQMAVYQRTDFLLKVLSGAGLVLFGLGLAYRRRAALAKGDQAHAHDHSHDHAHDHSHAPPIPEKLEAPKTGKKLGLVMAAPIEVAAPAHDHSHGHDHAHGSHTHTHDGNTHSHDGSMSEDEHAALHAKEAASEIRGFRDLLVLGISGGIVPCPAGVTLILFSISQKLSTFKTFVYLNSFSLGLGGVLVAIAAFMVISRSFLVRSIGEKRRGFFEKLPVLSALVVAVAGLAIVYEACDPGYTKALAKLSSAVSSREPGKPVR